MPLKVKLFKCIVEYLLRNKGLIFDRFTCFKRMTLSPSSGRPHNLLNPS